MYSCVGLRFFATIKKSFNFKKAQPYTGYAKKPLCITGIMFKLLVMACNKIQKKYFVSFEAKHTPASTGEGNHIRSKVVEFKVPALSCLHEQSLGTGCINSH